MFEAFENVPVMDAHINRAAFLDHHRKTLTEMYKSLEDGYRTFLLYGQRGCGKTVLGRYFVGLLCKKVFCVNLSVDSSVVTTMSRDRTNPCGPYNLGLLVDEAHYNFTDLKKVGEEDSYDLKVYLASRLVNGDLTETDGVRIIQLRQVTSSLRLASLRSTEKTYNQPLRPELLRLMEKLGKDNLHDEIKLYRLLQRFARFDKRMASALFQRKFVKGGSRPCL